MDGPDGDRGSGGPHLSTRISGSPSNVMPCPMPSQCHTCKNGVYTVTAVIMQLLQASTAFRGTRTSESHCCLRNTSPFFFELKAPS